MTFTARPDGVRTFFNERLVQYSGRTLSQLAGTGWRSGIHPDDDARVAELWRAALATGDPLEYELRLRGADGTYRWFLTRAVPLRDGRGRIAKWYGITADIEDRKRAELTVASLAVASDEVLVAVSDTGVGLPAEQAERIFDAFFTTKPQGSGMGLRICRAIVEAHGGRLWASANAERGATFRFTLPGAAAAPPA